MVTYNLTVAGYTQSGVGRESESLSVTTTLGRVISMGLRCARLSSAINQIILSQLSEIICFAILISFNRLAPKSDWLQISPFNITLESNIRNKGNDHKF